MREPSDLAYRADMLKLLKRVQQIISAELEPWVRENTRSDARTDSKEDELRRLFERVRVKTSEYTSRAAPVIAGRFVKACAEANRAAMNAQFRSVIKIDPFISNKGLEASMRTRLATNVELISSIPEKLIGQLETTVGPRVFSGVRVEETMKAIQERFDVSESRAQLIARDQTNKFNAQLTQERHEDLGIDSYVWSTSRDERVREDHAALDGETFSYDDPPVVDSKSGATANPGEDYQCRCAALPRVDAVLDALGVPDVADVGVDEAGDETAVAGDEAVSAGDEPPAWMNATKLDVVGDERVADAGMNDARVLRIQTPEGVQKAVWKTTANAEDWERMNIAGVSLPQREAAAADLDRLLHGKNAVVPPTVERKIAGEKGSLQAFVPAAKSGFDVEALLVEDPLKFASAPSQRRTFLLDVLTRNVDRHGGNLLWTDAETTTPRAHAIDNGCAFGNGKHAPPFRFIFDDERYIGALLSLDAESIATLQSTSVQDMGRVLSKYKRITKVQKREVLGRFIALRNDPKQLEAFTGTEFDAGTKLQQWAGLSPEEHGLSATELKEIDESLSSKKPL